MIGWRVSPQSSMWRVPPGFGIWLLFLVCAVAGAAVLGACHTGTAHQAPSPTACSRTRTGRGRTWGSRSWLLYAGNLTEDELPRRRLAWMLGVVAIYTILGGLAAMIKAELPVHLADWSVGPALAAEQCLHPGGDAARAGPVAERTGEGPAPTGRPKAPFEYTNTWGASLTMLVPWLIVGWWPGIVRDAGGCSWAPLVVVAAVPLLYSLNRAACWERVALASLVMARPSPSARARSSARVRRHRGGRGDLGCDARSERHKRSKRSLSRWKRQSQGRASTLSR